MTLTTARLVLGRIVLTVGVIILLFIPFLLWGTGLITQHSQSQLREQFSTALAHEQIGLPRTTELHPRPDTAPRPAPTVANPPAGTAVGVIDIPAIHLDMAIIEGTDTTQLRAGPGHYVTTPLPGEIGNAAIAGHRTTYLHPFYNLNELQSGDPIYVSTIQGLFEFQVASLQAVSPTDVAVVNPTPFPELTLTTCNPRYSAAQRLVLHALLTASVLAHPASSGIPARSPSTPGHPVPSVTSAETTGSWPAAIAWGLLVLVLSVGLWSIGRLVPGGRRLPVAVGGLVVWLGALYFFFTAAAPLLPASF